MSKGQDVVWVDPPLVKAMKRDGWETVAETVDEPVAETKGDDQ